MWHRTTRWPTTKKHTHTHTRASAANSPNWKRITSSSPSSKSAAFLKSAEDGGFSLHVQGAHRSVGVKCGAVRRFKRCQGHRPNHQSQRVHCQHFTVVCANVSACQIEWALGLAHALPKIKSDCVLWLHYLHVEQPQRIRGIQWSRRLVGRARPCTWFGSAWTTSTGFATR